MFRRCQVGSSAEQNMHARQAQAKGEPKESLRATMARRASDRFKAPRAQPNKAADLFEEAEEGGHGVVPELELVAPELQAAKERKFTQMNQVATCTS